LVTLRIKKITNDSMLGYMTCPAMFSLHTLPWFWKALILAYDVLKCWQQSGEVGRRSSADVFATTVHVFVCQVLFSFVLLGPSILLSVQDRHSTNGFISEMLLLLSSYLLLIRAIGTNSVSPENACFCLQFCSCYFFFCYFSATSKNSKLLLGTPVVRACSFCAMAVFPIMFSHLPQDCMHLSPYVLLFLFAGEVSACVCTVVSYVLVSLENVIDSLYIKFF
jgi:hypothetical protein